MSEYNQPNFKRKNNRLKSHSNICDKCNRRLKYKDSYYCKECKNG